MRFMFNNLRFAFNEMRFIKLEPFTFSKPNSNVTKYTIKTIRENERSGLLVVHPVCKYFLALFKRSLHITEIMFKNKVLCFFAALLVNELMPGTRMTPSKFLASVH